MGRLEKAVEHWNSSVRWAPSNFQSRRGLALCLGRAYLMGRSWPRFAEVSKALDEALTMEPGWEEGHQWRILIYGKEGCLDDLETFYAVGGDVEKRWLNVVRLEKRFRGQRFGSDGWSPERYRWILRGSGVLLGLFLTFISSIGYRKAYAEGQSVFFQLFLVLFGLMLAGGSAFLYWNGPKKQKPKADKAS